MSHIVPSIAYATGAALKAISGVSTVVATSQTRLKRVEGDLDAERRNSKRLRGQLDATELRASKLDRQLFDQRQRNADLQRQLRSPTNATRKARTRASELMGSISKRTGRVVAANLGSMSGEAIPFYGIGIIVAATTYELHVSCQNMKDLAELSQLMDGGEPVVEDAASVCGKEVPSKEAVWSTIKSSPGEAWSSSVAGLNATKDWAVSLEPPDFGALWDRTLMLLDW